MAQIPLRNRQGVIMTHALVDDEDAEEVGRWRWCLGWGGYAGRNDGRSVLLHRYLLGLEHGDPRQGDHKNRDRLDDRRANLRIVTRAEQQQNLPSMGGASRFRGVSICSTTGRWRATVVFQGRQYSCGRHESEIAAAKAAEAWRLEHMPFAMPDLELAVL